MAGFGKAFDEAFKPAQASGAAVSLEAIKEKIKQNEDVRQSGVIIDSIEARIIQQAEKTGKPTQEVVAISKALDGLRKAKLSATETLSVAKAISPEIFVDEGTQATREAAQATREAAQATREEGLDLRKQNRQDKLEKFHTDRLTKVLSNRTGGLGLQDNKVNQAIDLRTMVDGMQDPVTGEYKIPPSAHVELALGLAKLLSPTGVVSEGITKELEQRTLKQGLNGALIYLGFNPKEVGGTTQSVAQFMIKTIDRQGEVAETIRNKYLDGLKQTAPKGLDPETVDNLNKIEITSSFKDYLKNRTGIKEFKTEEEALKSGVKGIVMINGKRAKID